MAVAAATGGGRGEGGGMTLSGGAAVASPAAQSHRRENLIVQNGSGSLASLAQRRGRGARGNLRGVWRTRPVVTTRVHSAIVINLRVGDACAHARNRLASGATLASQRQTPAHYAAAGKVARLDAS